MEYAYRLKNERLFIISKHLMDKFNLMNKNVSSFQWNV